jgi:quercetin dioxygenase-like cupin family protein
MVTMNHSIVPPGPGAEYDWSSDRILVKTPGEVTDGRVTIIEDHLKPGFHLDRHQHRVMAELFYILDGEVVFAFDDEVVTAGVGTTVNVPAGTWHEVTCAAGGRLLTVFTPGGFDNYLAESKALASDGVDDPATATSLARRYDIWGEGQ